MEKCENKTPFQTKPATRGVLFRQFTVVLHLRDFHSLLRDLKISLPDRGSKNLWCSFDLCPLLRYWVKELFSRWLFASFFDWYRFCPNQDTETGRTRRWLQFCKLSHRHLAPKVYVWSFGNSKIHGLFLNLLGLLPSYNVWWKTLDLSFSDISVLLCFWQVSPYEGHFLLDIEQ